MLKEKMKKVWDIIETGFTWIMMIIAVAMMLFTVISVNTFDRNDRNLLGYKAFIVHSDSMSATDFNAGDLILVKEVDPSKLQVGDIISFISVDPNNYGETITHKIRELTTTKEGYPAFITYGTTTNVNDQYPVTYEYVVGKHQYTLKGVGSFFLFLKTVPGYICCILIPFLILIIIQGINSISLFRQYKEEQMAEIEEKRQRELDEMTAERERLEAERQKLEKLKAEMAEKGIRNEE